MLGAGGGALPVPGGELRAGSAELLIKGLRPPPPYVLAWASGSPWALPVTAHPPLPLEVSAWGAGGRREGTGGGRA